MARKNTPSTEIETEILIRKNAMRTLNQKAELSDEISHMSIGEPRGVSMHFTGQFFIMG